MKLWWCWHFHRKYMELRARHPRTNTNDFVIELHCKLEGCDQVHHEISSESDRFAHLLLDRMRE